MGEDHPLLRTAEGDRAVTRGGLERAQDTETHAGTVPPRLLVGNQLCLRDLGHHGLEVQGRACIPLASSAAASPARAGLQGRLHATSK